MSCFEERNIFHTSSTVFRASQRDEFKKIMQKFIFVEFIK